MRSINYIQSYFNGYVNHLEVSISIGKLISAPCTFKYQTLQRLLIVHFYSFKDWEVNNPMKEVFGGSSGVPNLTYYEQINSKLLRQYKSLLLRSKFSTVSPTQHTQNRFV